MHRFRGGLVHGARLALVLAWVALGCVASRGPTGGDGGADAADAKADTMTCPPPKAGNALSFDFTCTGECPGTTHFDYQLDPKSHGYPGCAEGTSGGNGIFQIPNNTTAPAGLPGPYFSTLQLQLEPYAGPGTYHVEAKPAAFNLSATIPFEAGPCEVSVIIPEVAIDGASATGLPNCTFVVTGDCADREAHTVTGTFKCNLPDAVSDGNCTIDNGTFSFGDCVP